MQKQAPTAGRLAVMVLFALSCFALLLFLWKAFGGTTPLAPKGYRVHVRFPEATQLAEQADVRISGVPVGRVVRLTQSGQRTDATLQLDERYAPIADDARAILRSKTLLGETYVEMTPGSPGAPKIPEGGSLADGRVASTVELDEVIRAFTPSTRRDLKRFVTGMAATLKDGERNLNDSIGNAGPLLDDSASLLDILDSQRGAVRKLVRDTGVTFDALGRNQAAVRTFVTAGDRLFATTAARDAELQQTLKVLPTFMDELRPTLAVARAAAADAAPVTRALAPAAPRVEPVLRDTIALTPDLRAMLREAGPLIDAARTGVPAATRTVKAAPALVRELEPAARDLRPVVDFLGLYRQELVQSWMNIAASTQATFQNPGAAKPLHYLRNIIPIMSEGLVTQSKRLASNRHNPYLAPLGLDKLASGLEAFSCANTANPQPLPVLGSTPPCKQQAPFEVDGATRSFPQLRRDP